jgi:hypothetical protein
MNEFGEHAEEQQPSKWKDRTILTLALLLIGVAIYAIIITLAVNTCKAANCDQNITGNMTKAYNDGIGTTIVQLIKSTNNCSVASINMYNNTRQVVDLECVRELLRSQNISLTQG